MMGCTKARLEGWLLAALSVLACDSVMAEGRGDVKGPVTPGKPRPADLIDRVYGPPPLPAGRPAALVEDPEFDWGEVFQGEVVQHTYRILNVGSETLHVLRVQPGCVADLVRYDLEVPPGEVGQVVFKVNTKPYSGQVTTKPVVETDDPDHKRLTLQLSGNVKRPLAFDPPHPVMSIRPGEEPRPMTVSIRRGSPDDPVRITKVEAEGGKLDHELEVVEEGSEYRLHISVPRELEPEPEAAEGGSEARFQISVHPDGAERRVPADARNLPSPVFARHGSRFREVFRFDVEAGGLSLTARLWVSVSLEELILTRPRGYIFFGSRDVQAALREAEDAEAERRKFITVESNDPGVTFKITRVAVVDDDGTYRPGVECVREGEKYKVWVEIIKRPELTGGETRHTAKVEILTDHPVVPELSLTIYAVFAEEWAEAP